MASLRALAYLGYRAIVAHPLKRLSRRGTGLARFEAAYAAEGLRPTTPEERAVRAAASACVGCGLCEPHCAIAGGPEVRALGLQAVFRLYTRSAEDLRRARSALRQCAGCTGCDAACPTGVPIARILRHLAGA
ncbi:MAG: 4Fe-4S dicluster domain-containing protein [Deltaproteobacteria bacterium]|nr:4Fe-4S dicluster domain-containing protein [Deltaproteobacteria bacterium]